MGSPQVDTFLQDPKEGRFDFRPRSIWVFEPPFGKSVHALLREFCFQKPLLIRLTRT